ncbi:HD domain-containing protein [Oceanobacillus profundus]|uniref:HD domain-containing protein n=1 Tax=Oceanobacillus TaxID=182709 RepID=UPI000BA7A30C|nr:HD domain-containing protein [Oceanobacillus profundus]MBQ6445849.1 HD domain-containing protein [Bacillus sp. (in: firmicutes)]MBR3120233.1 HD domain-containing protein [Oceanobacillus sp.]PAE27943.1 phosphohydrolase [Paenibacillus sp. 7884-2]MCM3397903.1 HD domain-containing protein [Oceanobacillus profundus]MDO6448873.1 HD domain-containing protein [Oceanobacillus profundus]
MQQTIAGIKIPDSRLAKDAADILREYGNDLLWNHSNRVFLFGAVNGEKAKQNYDLELLYISALFHDLGLTKKYSSADLRFEVDGANAARSFLQQYKIPNDSIQLVWDAIALHTTPGVAEHKESEVALLFHGVGLDVMGDGFEQFPEDLREDIIKAFPRNNFKKEIIPAFYDGFKHKPETTFGNMKEDVVQYFRPEYKNKNFCQCILHSPWSE